MVFGGKALSSDLRFVFLHLIFAFSHNNQLGTRLFYAAHTLRSFDLTSSFLAFVARGSGRFDNVDESGVVPSWTPGRQAIAAEDESRSHSTQDFSALRTLIAPLTRDFIASGLVDWRCRA